MGDEPTLAPFPLILGEAEWQRLARWAEALAAEAVAAERELLSRPELLARLGLPRRLRTLFTRIGPSLVAAEAPTARVMRFDFHPTTGSPTTHGWQISEANADVPGGYAEASTFTRLMAGHFAELEPAGDPAAAWADAIAEVARASARPGPVALLAAAGYMEDQQVVAHLANRLGERGLAALLAQPRHLRWEGGAARLEADWYRGPVSAIVRFYQGEWLAALPRREGRAAMLEHLIGRSQTSAVNPGSALLVESKRFPVTWPPFAPPCRRGAACCPRRATRAKLAGGATPGGCSRRPSATTATPCADRAGARPRRGGRLPGTPGGSRGSGRCSGDSSRR